MMPELLGGIFLLICACVLIYKDNMRQNNKIELIQWNIQKLKGGSNP